MKQKAKKGWVILVALVLAALLAVGGGVYLHHQNQVRAAALAAEQAAAVQAEELAVKQAAEQKAAEEKAAAEAAAKQKAEEEAAAKAAEEAKRAEEAAAAKANVQYGDKIGRVWVENTQVDCDLYWGDTASIFHAGAGCSADNGCVMPGDSGTVFVGGHTDTFFVDLKSAEIGDIIHLETLWGDYTYQVTEMKKISDTDVDECRWGATEPSCILYTCYPFGIQVPTPYRWLVYADPVEISTPEQAAQP